MIKIKLVCQWFAGGRDNLKKANGGEVRVNF
jgi:hypothetical protein